MTADAKPAHVPIARFEAENVAWHNAVLELASSVVDLDGSWVIVSHEAFDAAMGDLRKLCGP